MAEELKKAKRDNLKPDDLVIKKQSSWSKAKTSAVVLIDRRGQLREWSHQSDYSLPD